MSNNTHMAKRAYHVSQSEGRWEVKLERSGRAQSKHRYKKNAITKAKNLARRDSTAGDKVVILDSDGAIQRHVTPR